MNFGLYYGTDTTNVWRTPEPWEDLRRAWTGVGVAARAAASGMGLLARRVAEASALAAVSYRLPPFVALAPASVPADCRAPRRSVVWRGHVGWVRRGTRRPL